MDSTVAMSVVGGNVGAGGERTLKRKRAPEAFVGAPAASSAWDEEESEESKRRKGLGVSSSTKYAVGVGFSPETSVTPSVGLEWDSPLGAGSQLQQPQQSYQPAPQQAQSQQQGAGRTPNSSVVSHYNSVACGATLSARAQSPLLALRRVNNFIKANFLTQFCRKPGYRVLDMACGKGGDLHKWAKLGIREWVGVDIAPVAVREAGSRYNKMKERTFAARLIVADATRVPIWQHVGPVATGGAGFDIVSCQFAFHYACESEAQARMMLWNIASFLKPGAYFIGSTIDEGKLREKLGPDRRTVANKHFALTMHEPLPASADELDFGVGYDFTLGDLVNCPEYVVPMKRLKTLAAEYDLKLTYTDNFIHGYKSYKKSGKYNALLKNIAASQSEWDIVSLYTTFAFQKTTGSHSLDRPAPATYHPVDLDAAICVLDA